MLSTRYRLELSDICCRIVSDGPVTLEERIWMNKLISHNESAKSIADSILALTTLPPLEK
tara:strand:- start:188 stop:367 length:180 start_codon:yes stop_codon:yes gene_type:complete